MFVEKSISTGNGTEPDKVAFLRSTMDIDLFKENLRNLTIEQMFDRCILTGSCAQLGDDAAHAVRSSISQKFAVEYNNVIIVGSANLGFSIKPRKRYVSFGEESDVDVAIVCNRLFEQVWREIYLYDKSGAYWESKAAFRKYLAKEALIYSEPVKY